MTYRTQRYGVDLAVVRGFTLLELMVALAVFAVVSLISYGGLRSVLDTRESTDRVAEELAELQLAFGLIGRDADQMVNRAVRDELGDPLPSIMSGEINEPRLEFTCLGFFNHPDIPSPGLIRVGYDLVDGGLTRFVWPVLDRGFGSEPRKTRLVGKVSALEIRFLDNDRQWHTQWPPVKASSTTSAPRAMELTLELEDWGRITRLYNISG